MTAKTASQSKIRSARKRRSDNTINQAAAGVIGLSPLVGVRSEDIGDAMKATLRNTAKQPLGRNAAGLAELYKPSCQRRSRNRLSYVDYRNHSHLPDVHSR